MYSHDEFIPGLGINKDELQEHNKDITAKDIETFNGLEKFFNERTYIDSDGIRKHKDGTPVSEEALRLWRIIDVDPKTRQYYEYYAPFVKNNTQVLRYSQRIPT